MGAAGNVPFIHVGLKNPSDTVRCLDAATSPPFRSSTFFLKQTVPNDLDEVARNATAFFGAFFERWHRSKESEAALRKEELIGLDARLGEYDHEFEQGPNRRYAGSLSLPKSRYYSVCHSVDGVDDGTMVRELRAYHDALAKGWIEISDWPYESLSAAGGPERAPLGSDSTNESAFAISILPPTSAECDWLRGLASPNDIVVILLPARVTRASFERVIDLRYPEVAQWFAYNLTRLHWNSSNAMDAPSPAFPHKQPLEKFSDLLPSLLTQTMGGGEGATRIAGQWLRTLGADALVYPSARSDARVNVNDGEVIDWYGWNLVDYRDIEPIRTVSYDWTFTWIAHIAQETDQPPSSFYQNTKIEVSHEGRSADSWSVKNLERTHHAWRLVDKAAYLYKWSMGALSEESRNELSAVLGGDGSPEGVERKAGSLISAFLGDHDLRERIATMMERASTSDRFTLLNFREAFRLMDEKTSQL